MTGFAIFAGGFVVGALYGLVVGALLVANNDNKPNDDE